MDINLNVPTAYRFLYESDQRYLVAHGGRAAGKTWAISERMVSGIIQEKDSDIVYPCLRETQESLQYSTKSTIIKAIRNMNLNKYFYTTRTSREITCLINGAKFLFRGIRNKDEADKIRSIENVGMAWIEECHNLKEDVWDVITPSFRQPGSKIILSFNPMRKSDFTYDNFVVNNDELAEVRRVNYYDNPYFFQNDVLVKEMEACKKRNMHKFRRVWLGEPGFIENQLINPEWWRLYDSLDSALKVCTGMFITADTAYKEGKLNDFTVLQLWGYNSGRQLYLLDQERGKWSFPDLVDKTVSFTKRASSIHQFIAPARVYIEDKASGTSLVQTLARVGINVVAWNPRHYHFPPDKVGRVNEASLMVSDKIVYLPKFAPWVNGFITECSEFSEDKDTVDDQVDAMTMAISIFRSMGGGIRI